MRKVTTVEQPARRYACDFDEPSRLAASMGHRDRTTVANVLEWRRGG
ncbi:hypothetical protein ABT288_12255 [Streptomyces sp. NPDC001093]